MKLKILVLAPALVLLAAACSKPMSPQEYFGKVSDIKQQVDDAEASASDDMRTTLADPSASPEQAVAAFTTYLKALIAAADDSLAALDELKPPSDVADEHDAFLEAQTDLVKGLKSVLADAEGAQATDIQSIMADHTQEMDSLSQKADSACQDLQDAADEAGVTVQLCGTSDADKLAQSSARNGMAAAKTLFTDTDDYSGISAQALGQLEPNLNWVDSPAPSPNANTVSVWTDGDMVFAEAVLSETGSCFWMKDDATSGSTYGTGTAETCTGEDASAAADSNW